MLLPDREGLRVPFGVLVLRGGQHRVLQFLQRGRAQRPAPVQAGPLRRRMPQPRPRHQGQVPGQRDDHVGQLRFRHQGLQHDRPDHERRGQQPVVCPLDVSLVQDRALRDAVDHPRPGVRVQPVLRRAQRRVMNRAAVRPDLPLPRHHRRRDRHDLQEHHDVARPDLLRARHRQRRPVLLRHHHAVLQRRHQVRQPHRDHDPGRKIRLICGNTDSKRRGRVGMHGGSLRRRV